MRYGDVMIHKRKSRNGKKEFVGTCTMAASAPLGLTPDLPLHNLPRHTEHAILPQNTQATCTCTLDCTRCRLLLFSSPPICPRSLGRVTFCCIMKKCNRIFPSFWPQSIPWVWFRGGTYPGIWSGTRNTSKTPPGGDPLAN